MKKQVAKTLFLNSFQKEIRTKTLWFLLISSFLVMLTSKAFFKWFTTQVDFKMAFGTIDLFFYYYVTFLWTLLMTGLLGVNSIKSDTRYGMSEQILAFPIRSESYLFLRVLSTSLIIWGFYLLLFCMMAIFLIGSSALTPYAIVAPLVFFCFIFSMTLLATLFSLFLGQVSGLVAIILGTFIIIFVNQHLSDFNTFYPVALIINALFPPLGTVAKISGSLVFKTPIIGAVNLWTFIPHYIVSTAFLFWFTNLLFRRRGFK